MSAIARNRTAPASPLFGGLRGVIQRVAQYRMYRATLNELQHLGDRELDDLGLHRSQLRAVAYDAAYRT